jgi:GDP-L-fucose synthase
MTMDKDSRIYIAGHNDFVGSAILRRLKELGYRYLLLRSDEELDLKNQQKTNEFFESQMPEYVFLAKEKVGGILANATYPADFIYENLAIQTNVLRAAFRIGVKKLLFLGSSCSYPKECPQPMKEEYILTGSLEPTNEAYAVAKIAGMKMCQAYNKQYGTNFIVVIPANLYGIGDDFHPENSHVIAALIRKFHEAKEKGEHKVIIWGSGRPKREFLYIDDFADACIFLMREYDGCEIINIGTSEDISIKELAELIKEIVGFEGEVVHDTTKPDGMPRKLLDVRRINTLGWKAKIRLEEGIKVTYNWYKRSGIQ